VAGELEECVRLLLSAKARLGNFTKSDMLQFKNGNYPFYKNGIMQMLVDSGTDVTAFASINQLMLPRADDALLSVLLRAAPRPNLNQRQDWGGTLLSGAIYRYTKVKLLLDAGADPTICDKSGNIPLFEAEHANTVAALLDAAPDTINCVDDAGRNVFMNACLGIRSDLARRRNGRPLKCRQSPEFFFGHLGALDTSATDKYGDTVLHIAMSMVQTTVVEKLLELPIDVFRGNKCGHTVLMKPFASPGYHRGAQDDRDISACLAMVSDHVLRLPAVQRRTRKEPGDADGGSSSEEACAKRRRG
jgi:hypothetical protein